MDKIRSILNNAITSQRLNKDVLISICRNCGFPLSSSFTKARLAEIISTNLSQPSLIHNPIRSPSPQPSKAQRKEHTILSLDMGIKNFSYCKLQIDADSPFQRPIQVAQWSKLNLLNWTQNSQDMEFNPENYSNLASKIIFDLILPGAVVPDLILIERQRFRSMGSATVLETVMKSAVLENMLFASLVALRRENPRYKYMIQSSSPLTMTSFWESYRTLNEEVKFNRDAPSSKKQRISLVTDWVLNSRKRIEIAMLDDEKRAKVSEIKNESRRLFEIVNYINHNALKKFETEKQKGDDLADSLLHGITWLDFERNKTRISEVLLTNPENLVDELRSIEMEHVHEINVARQVE